jgi:hypothetical protein
MTDFFFNFWAGDQHLAPRLIGQILAQQPNARVAAIADGPISNVVARELVRHPQVSLFRNQARLKLVGQCEAYLARGLEQALAATRSPHLIQLDPDSSLNRPPILPPANIHWAGQIYWESGYQLLGTVGAGVYFSRQLVERLAAHLGTLPRRDYQNFVYRDGRASADCTMAHHLAVLGYKPEPWLDASQRPLVSLSIPRNTPEIDSKFVITHPSAV